MAALTLASIERLLPGEQCKTHASLITLKYIFKELLWILPWDPCWFVRQSLYLKLHSHWMWEHGWLTALQIEGRMHCCISAKLGITNTLFSFSCAFLPRFFSCQECSASVIFAIWFPWFNIAKQPPPPPYFQMFTEVNFPMAASSWQRPLAETALLIKGRCQILAR